jgi:hypothetical protein
MTQAAFFTGLYVLGLALSHGFAARLGKLAQVVLAFPIGAFAWVLIGIITLGIGIPFTAVGMAVTVGLVALLAVGLHIRRKALPLRLALVLAATIPAFFAAVFLVTRVNWAEFSFDSHYILVVAKGLAFEGAIAGRLGNQLSEWGAFQLLFHSAAELYGTPYFYAASALIGAHVIALLVWLTARLLGGPDLGWRHLAWGLTAAVALGSVHFVVFHFFYIHTNFPAALFLLLFAGCGWGYLREEDDAWLPPVFIGAAALALQRTETPLPAVIFLVLLMAEQRRVSGYQLRLSFGFAAVLVFWEVVLLRHIGEGTTILSPSKVYLLMAVVLGFLAVAGLCWYPKTGKLKRWLNPATLLALSVATLITTLSKPAHMSESFFSVFANLYLGYWGAAWFMVLALAILSLLLPRLEVGKFVSTGLISYTLLILLLGFMREPYAIRWADSANRMFLHLLPLTLLFFAVRFGVPLLGAARWSAGQPAADAGRWKIAVEKEQPASLPASLN